jgi:exopolysaccharide/PEP-CTERM locus tyrosine autokinase
MSLIEKAAKRLEELRRSGAPVSDGVSTAEAASSSTPDAVVRALEARRETIAESIATPIAVPSSGMPQTARGAPHAPEAVVAAPTGAAAARASRAATTTSRTVAIDLESLKARGYVTPDAPTSRIADEFRVIKRPIIRNAQGRAGAKVKHGNLVMVTSALPSEGKTFTALNLAMSVAMEFDNTVLLVDGDVANPAMPKLLGVPEAPGLLDLLTNDKIDVSDALVKTNVEKLTVLPAGRPHRRATELLASEQMVALLRDLASRYQDRIIIFDSPPLLPTTEARVLATHMGQIVMVVAAEATSQNTLNQALVTIESCEHVMMLLNKASRTEAGAYGYYSGDSAR